MPASGSEPPSLLGAAVRACRPHLVAVGAFSAAISLLYLMPTLYMMQVYDRVVPTGGLGTLAMVSLTAAFGLGALAALDWVRLRLLVRVGARVDAVLAVPVMTAVLGRPSLSRIERSQAMRDFDTVRQTLSGHAVVAAFDAPWTLVYVAAAFLMSPKLGMMCLASVGLLLLLAWLNERATTAPMHTANQATNIAYAKQDNTSAYAAEVRALGMREAMVLKQLGERARGAQLQLDASFAAAGFSGLTRFVRLVLQSAALGVGALLVIRQEISPGAMIAASFLLTRALSPIELVVGSWRGIANARTAWGRLSKVLAELGAEKHTALPTPRGQLQLERVTVTSPDRARVLLAEVAMTIEPGEMVGVVGPSGAGKSTLMRAMVGSAGLADGVVRLDGAALGDWDSERLARHIGYLPQDFTLFAGTVKENISRFQGYLPEADPARIDAEAVTAAEACGAHDMILRLPQGYDTPVGLGGMGLSAGQTQRVALARALYGRPCLLVLDEPNAHLDQESEAVLCEHLARLKAQGVTIVVSAHHGAVLNLADKLAHLHSGRLVAFGSLQEVAERMRAAIAASPDAAAPQRRRKA